MGESERTQARRCDCGPKRDCGKRCAVRCDLGEGASFEFYQFAQGKIIPMVFAKDNEPSVENLDFSKEFFKGGHESIGVILGGSQPDDSKDFVPGKSNKIYIIGDDDPFFFFR